MFLNLLFDLFHRYSYLFKLPPYGIRYTLLKPIKRFAYLIFKLINLTFDLLSFLLVSLLYLFNDFRYPLRQNQIFKLEEEVHNLNCILSKFHTKLLLHVFPEVVKGVTLFKEIHYNFLKLPPLIIIVYKILKYL